MDCREAAWAAGVFDACGRVVLSRRRQQAAVHCSDPAGPLRLYTRWGGRLEQLAATAFQPHSHKWSAQGHTAVPFLADAGPYMTQKNADLAARYVAYHSEPARRDEILADQ